MSPEVWYAVLFVALALASYSFSVLLGFSPVFGRGRPNAYLKPEERLRRLALILVTAASGIAAVGSVASWEEWPAGLLLGAAAVETGPVVVTKTRAAIGRLFSKVGK